MKRLLIMAGLSALGTWGQVAEAQGNTQAAGARTGVKEVAADFGCLLPPTLTPSLPVDSLLTEQPEVNCFAWQEFIALNWKASKAQPGQPDTSVGADRFGAPGFEDVVWETFKEASEVFPPNGRAPTAWGATPKAPAGCTPSEFTPASGERPKVLYMTSKFSPDLEHRQILDEVNEAGVAPPAWLTAQSGKTVRYEVLLNQDYFNYVVDPNNQFYDARNQFAAVQPGGQGINFPTGVSRYGQAGSIEIKAGWLEVERADWDKYLMTNAVIVTPGPKPSCRTVRMGLVALHIIHKTPSMPNWTWATFEHVKNAPDRTQVDTNTLAPPYTFFKPNCQPASAPQCQPNRKPQSGDPMERPIQVVREIPIPGYVESLNKAVHAMIAKANPRSVFRNYKLVNTQWPQSGIGFGLGTRTPLSQGGAAPTTGNANTAAETYAQHKTCLDCHQFAPIACSSVSGPSPTWAADYTFQMSRASEPTRPEFCKQED